MSRFSKDQIANLLATNNTAVYMALVTLYNRQTADERIVKDTKHQNGMGFNGRDAAFATDLAQQVIHWYANDTFGKRNTFNNPLSPNQLQKARQLLGKYAGQLARIANERATYEENTHEEHRASRAESEHDMGHYAEPDYDAELERYIEDRNEAAYALAGHRDY